MAKRYPQRNIETGARLKEWAISRWGSVHALATAMGLSHPSTLYQYVQGQSRPGNRMQERLRALGCDIEWLLGYTDKPIGMAEPEKWIVLFNPDEWTPAQQHELRELAEEIVSKLDPENVHLAREILRPLFKHHQKKGKGA